MTDKKRPTIQQDRPGVAGAGECGSSRYILCPTCREAVEDENEPDTVVVGHIKLPDVRCDRCSDPLPVGSGAAAVTFYDSHEEYESWEHEHLTTQ